MQKLSSAQIHCILNLLDSGLYIWQISHQTGHGIATISCTCSDNWPELQKSSGGCPTKLSTTNIKYAHWIICMGKIDDATEAAKTLQDITNSPFSSQTLRQHLKSCGMRPVVKRKHPLLKPHHQWARLEFAEQKVGSAPMFSLYSAINSCLATQEEIDLASGQTIFDPSKHSNYIKSIQVSQLDICHALQNQANVAAVSWQHIRYCSIQPFIFLYQGPWNQVKFENMLAEWIFLTNQPFNLVDNTAFCELVTYVHHPAPKLKIPHCDAMKRRIMKLGEDTIRSTNSV